MECRSELFAWISDHTNRTYHRLAAIVGYTGGNTRDGSCSVVGLGRSEWHSWRCAIAYERNSQWVENATLIPATACLTWTFGGWPLLRRAWPAIVFLVFLFPLPPGVNGLIAIPLQMIAATGSCFLLQLSGFWAIQEGNVIHLMTPRGMMPLDVALACNGLRMLMTMAATITATVILIPLPTWKRITLLVSTVPVALVSNIIRIVATGWCYYWVTGPEAKQWSHDVSGLLMMPLALVLVGLELRLLSWLSPDITGVGNLRLMPSVNDVSGIPRASKNLTIVAIVDQILHFRIFDADGVMVADTSEKRLKEKSRQIENLWKQLESLWPPHKLTKEEEGLIIDTVTSIVGHKKPLLPGLYERTSGKDKQQNADLDELPKDENGDRKVILPVFYEKSSGKKKQQTTDLDELA